MFNEVKDHGGERKKFAAGGEREVPKGKGRFDLIPPHPLFRLALHYENGAGKYPERNWEKGLPMHRFIESAMRHLNQFVDGDRTEDHLAAAAWNIFGYMATENWIARGILSKEFYNVPWAPSLPEISLEEANAAKKNANNKR